MRVINNPPPRPAGARTITVAAEPAPSESIAATWCREIATAVGDALNTPVAGLACHLTLRQPVPAPWLLHAGFHTCGHQVDITVVWDDPRREPGFALHVDNQPVALDTHHAQRPAVVLAHAAWQAITDHQPTNAATPAATTHEAVR
jgi:hypothetical protein